jgi:hypothetical protein
MEQNNNKEIAGVWMFRDADHAMVFFELKAQREKELGRPLTGNEVHLLMVELKNVGEIAGFEVNGSPGNVKAILTEHFNVYKVPKKEDLED